MLLKPPRESRDENEKKRGNDHNDRCPSRSALTALASGNAKSNAEAKADGCRWNADGHSDDKAKRLRALLPTDTESCDARSRRNNKREDAEVWERRRW